MIAGGIGKGMEVLYCIPLPRQGSQIGPRRGIIYDIGLVSLRPDDLRLVAGQDERPIAWLGRSIGPAKVRRHTADLVLKVRDYQTADDLLVLWADIRRVYRWTRGNARSPYFGPVKLNLGDVVDLGMGGDLTNLAFVRGIERPDPSTGILGPVAKAAMRDLDVDFGAGAWVSDDRRGQVRPRRVPPSIIEGIVVYDDGYDGRGVKVC